MSDTQHTPGPWRAHFNEYEELLSIVYGHGRAILRPHHETDVENGAVRVVLSSCNLEAGDDFEAQHHIDIAFLVRACNSHDALLAACEALLDGLENFLHNECTTFDNPHPEETDETCIAARAAIAKAKGEKE